MGPEKYSKQAFLESQAKQKELYNEAKRLETAKQLTSLTKDALKAQYNVEGERQNDLVNLAHEEALKMDEKANEYRVTRFKRVEFRTESGNTYIMQRLPDGKNYTVMNMREGYTTDIPSEKLKSVLVVKGMRVSVPGFFQTTKIVDGTAER